MAATAILFLVVWYFAYMLYYWVWGYKYDLEAIRRDYVYNPPKKTRRRKKQSLQDLYTIEELDNDLL